MSAEDKYPKSSGRRRFVKGVVGSAGLSAVGMTGAVTVDSATNRSGTGGGTTEFFAVENIGGPAPRGMPMIPLEVDSEGYLRGRYPEVSTEEINGEEREIAEEDIAGITYSSDWFQYCGIQGYGGIYPGYEGDNYFRHPADSSYDWQGGLSGNRIHIDEFDDYDTWTNGIGEPGLGKPANATWRSEDTENTIPVQVLRSTRIEEMAQNLEGQAGDWLREASSEGAIAWLNKCTHYCCVPGFKKSTYGNADNHVYCPCHQSIYDPFSIVKRAFVAYPRPNK
mgnify:CR=1 FL=1